MQYGRIPAAKGGNRRRRRQCSDDAGTSAYRRAIARMRPRREPVVKYYGRRARIWRKNECAVGQVFQISLVRLHGPSARNRPFCVESLIDIRGGGSGDPGAGAHGVHPGIIGLPAAFGAGTMPGGQGHSLIQEEQLRPAIWRHKLSVTTLELERAYDPVFMSPKRGFQPFVGTVQNAAIAGKKATCAHHFNSPIRRHAVLQRRRSGSRKILAC